MPREQTPSPPRLLMPAAPRDAIAPDVATLHRELEILRMEREAMLVEEMDLVTAKDLRATRSNDVAKYRKRISELLARAAEKARKDNAPPTSPAPQPTPKGPATQAPNQPPAPLISPSAPATVANPPESSPRPMSTTPTIKPADNSARVVTDTPVDPLALAQSYFQAGDYAAALNAYRKLEQEQPRAEDLVIIQYMRACCLRKLGKLDEASVLYREAANTAGNEFVAENAQWYLRTMKERRELEAQLDELRQRRQSLMPRKP